VIAPPAAMIAITEKDGFVVLRVRVQPGAPRNQVAGELNGVLKLKVAAPPVDGKANQECCRFISRLLEVPRGSVEITAGATSRTKTIIVRNVTAEHARSHLTTEHSTKVAEYRSGDAARHRKC